jgi:hypothetical protein
MHASSSRREREPAPPHPDTLIMKPATKGLQGPTKAYKGPTKTYKLTCSELQTKLPSWRALVCSKECSGAGTYLLHVPSSERGCTCIATYLTTAPSLYLVCT